MPFLNSLFQLVFVSQYRVPLFILQWYKQNELEEPYTGAAEIATDSRHHTVTVLGTILGVALAANYSLHFAIGVARKRNWVKEGGTHVAQAFSRENCVKEGGARIVQAFSQTSNLVGTARTKKAATRKVNLMLTNARQMHGTIESKDCVQITNSLRKSQSDTVFQNYTLFGEKYEESGSLVWTWKQMYSGHLFDAEGVWLPARLWIFQVGQAVVAVLVYVALFEFVESTVRAADEANEELTEGLPRWVYDIVPTGREVNIALLPAAWVAVVVCGLVALIYIPR
jgi:hypothetical protein